MSNRLCSNYANNSAKKILMGERRKKWKGALVLLSDGLFEGKVNNYLERFMTSEIEFNLKVIFFPEKRKRERVCKQTFKCKQTSRLVEHLSSLQYSKVSEK